MLPFFVILPLAAAFLASLAGKFHRRVVELIASTTCLVLAIMSVALMSKVGFRGASIVYKLGGIAPGLGVSFAADGLSVYMLAIANMISLAVALYSIGYMKRYTDTWKYYTLLMIMVSGINGVVLTADIFNMFVFLEIASISVCALIAFGNEDGALEASFKYAVMGTVASSFILIGIAFIYGYASTLSFSGIANALAGKSAMAVVRFAGALLLAGFAFKAALAPFHAWMPDAYANAPAPVPAMSSGAMVKALGVYALARLFFNVFGTDKAILGVFVCLAVISMVLGSIMAFGQTNIKRLLGFSSISQIGYILLGLGVGTPLSIMAALFHIFNHSVAKSLLFINAGEMEDSGHGDTEPAMIAVRPAVRISSLMGVLSLCGVPPFAGFWSKLLIIIACVQANRPGLAFIAAFVSILTLAYYFKAYSPIISAGSRASASGNKISRSVLLTDSVLLAMALLALFGGIMLLPVGGKALLNNASSVLTSGMNQIAVISGVIK